MRLPARPAKRSSAKPLIGFYSKSGGGKTNSALLLARGFVGPNGKIGMVETEAGRGEVYQGHPDIGDYTVYPIRESFPPADYGDSITEAEKDGIQALIIDSASHEWEGAGGVCDMASKNKPGINQWQQPKMLHFKHFMSKMMNTPIPLVIVCMRAKYKMEEFYDDEKRKKSFRRRETLSPQQDGDILYELMAHGWFDDDHCYHGTKYTRDDLRPVLVDGQRITVETGRRLAAWSRDEPAEMTTRLRDVLGVIDAARSLDELAVVAKGLKAEPLDGHEAAIARNAYKRRHNDLRRESFEPAGESGTDWSKVGPPPMGEDG